MVNLLFTSIVHFERLNSSNTEDLRNAWDHKLQAKFTEQIIKNLTIAVILVLAGCAGQVARQDSASSSEQEPVSNPPDPMIVSIEPVRPKIDLSEELLYKILEAEFAGQRGHLDVALANYLELARSTRDPKIVERATRISVFARDTTMAEEMAILWVELDPRNPDPHQVLAVMAMRNGDVEKSLVHLESILDYTYGDLDQKLLMIANMLGREADTDLIMQVMDKLVDKRQDSPVALFAFSRVSAILGEYQRALDLLEQALTLKPEDDGIALSYIAVLQRLGRDDDALVWLEDALEDRGDNDFNLRLTYARFLMDVSRYDDSRRQFEILAVQAPNNADVLFALGLLYLQENRIDDAEKQFTHLSRRGGRSNEVNYYLGRIAEGREEFDKAGVWYQGVQSGPNYFDSQVRLARMLARQDRLDDARKHLTTILTQNEAESSMLIQAQAELMVELDRYDEALEIYDQAIDAGYNPDLLYSRAMLAEKMDRLDILEADLRSILDQDPQNAQALNALGYTLADRTNRYAEAEKLIDMALELRPNDHYILDSKGWVLYRQGRLDEAIEYLRRAMELIPDGEIAAHLGEVLWVKGDKKEAKKVWDTALKSAPDNALLQDVIQRFNP